MKAAVYTKYGPPEVLQLKEIEKPVPGDNEILVRIQAVTVTSADVRMRKADPILVRGFNGLFHPKNQILGAEFSGTADSIGKNVKEFTPGDEVFGSSGINLGTYTQFKCFAEDSVIAHKPDGLSFAEAAAMSFGGLSSLHFLKKANIVPGQKVLVYGASGSLGTAAVQLARYFGARVTGVCSTRNTELVKSLGADRVLDYTKEDIKSLNETFDVIYDTVGKSPFSVSLKLLKESGYYLRAVHISPSSLARGMWTNLTGSKKVIGGMAGETKEDLLFLKKLAEEGKYKPVIDKTFPFEQISDAHRYVETGHKRGNVIIKM